MNVGLQGVPVDRFLGGVSGGRNCGLEVLRLHIARDGDLAELSRGRTVERGVPFQRYRNLPGISRGAENRLPFAQVRGRDREFERCGGRKRAGSMHLGGAGGGGQFRKFQLARTETVGALSVPGERKLRLR